MERIRAGEVDFGSVVASRRAETPLPGGIEALEATFQGAEPVSSMFIPWIVLLGLDVASDSRPPYGRATVVV